MVTAPVEVGEIVAEKYRVDTVIGQGGMGVVVAAHHIELEQKVAIKFLLADVIENTDAAERFRREARAVAQIHSDHVVRVLDVGALPDGTPYMVMEYLDGYDIGDRIAKGERFDIEEAVGYALEAIDAVAHAHEVGIVHRDLKPANLFLAKRPDGSLRVKVLDFGISKSISDNSLSDMRLTSTTTLIGSPLYMSPEQMQSARDVDARADIWSLGAILFEMLTARPPYTANNLPQLCQALLTSDPPKLRELREDVPAGLEEVIAYCLKRDLSQRWQSMTDLGVALAPFAPRHRSVRPAFRSSVDVARDSQLDAALSDAMPAATEEPGSAGTFRTWDKNTDGSNTKALGLGAAALVVLIVLAVFWLRPSATRTAPAASGGSAAPPASVVTTIPDQPAKRPTTIVEPVDAPETERDPTTSASQATPPLVRPPSVARPPAVPIARPAVESPAAGQGEPGSKPSDDRDLSDFGGRR